MEQQHSDMGTPELRQHAVIIEEASQEGRRARNLTQAPLDTYLNRGSITQRQYEAGNLFYKDFSRAGLTTLKGIQLKADRVDGLRKEDMSEVQAFHHTRWHKAKKNVSGKIGQDLLINVCCFGYYANELQILHYKTSTMVVGRLKEALDELGDFYGLPKE